MVIGAPAAPVAAQQRDALSQEAGAVRGACRGRRVHACSACVPLSGALMASCSSTGSFSIARMTLFIMRNVASVRTLNMRWFPISTRLALGAREVRRGRLVLDLGVGGRGTLRHNSLPFALAFLAGCGAEALFTMLDRLSRAPAEPPAEA